MLWLFSFLQSLVRPLGKKQPGIGRVQTNASTNPEPVEIQIKNYIIFLLGSETMIDTIKSLDVWVHPTLYSLYIKVPKRPLDNKFNEQDHCTWGRQSPSISVALLLDIPTCWVMVECWSFSVMTFATRTSVSWDSASSSCFIIRCVVSPSSS